MRHSSECSITVNMHKHAPVLPVILCCVGRHWRCSAPAQPRLTPCRPFLVPARMRCRYFRQFLTPLSLCMCSVIVVALGGGVWCCVEGGRSKWAVATRAPKYTVQLRPVIGQEVLAALCMCVCMCVCSTCQVASHGRVHADKDGHAGGGMGTTPGSWA